MYFTTCQLIKTKRWKVISLSALGRNVSGNWRLCFVFTAPVFSANLNNLHCSLKTHLFPKTLRNQGRNMFEKWKPLLTASSCLWNPPDTERGCLLAPTQSPGVLRMDCLSSFLHGYRGRVCSASPPESSLRRGDWRRPLGVFIVFTGLQASHDCMNVDRLTGHPSTLNCTICMHVFACVYYKRARVFEVDEWPKDFKPAQWMWLILDFKAYTTTIIYRIYIYMYVCRG